uniref:Trichome birefringence-like C-terminal domain-containing protein n=1 Tax=Oryza punctata TaxID=4537 RepID=A0A0E0LJ27_ORYPU
MGGHQAVLDPDNQKPSSKNPGYFLSKHTCAWLAFGFLSSTSSAAPRPALDQQRPSLLSSSTSTTLTPLSQQCHVLRYNATKCNRWQPAVFGCPLSVFDAGSFLTAVHGKHVACIGDSMARNQAQSLICLLVAAFPYRLQYGGTGDPGKYNLWRYVFPSYDVSVSFYWAPFLVRAEGKPVDDSVPYNYVHLDEPGDRWSADAATIDVAVLAAGHRLMNGAIYYNGSEHGLFDETLTSVLFMMATLVINLERRYFT